MNQFNASQVNYEIILWSVSIGALTLIYLITTHKSNVDNQLIITIKVANCLPTAGKLKDKSEIKKNVLLTECAECRKLETRFTMSRNITFIAGF